MDDKVAIAVVGAAGRMGRMLVAAVREAPGASLSGVTVRPGHPWAGQDVGAAMGGAPIGVWVEDDALEVFARSHAVLDFTTPDATVAHAELAAQARLTHVIGTTGLEPAHLAHLRAAGRHATIVRAGNMSVGLNLLVEMTRKVTEVLGPDYDVEIVEMHHRHKVDAPSGTALMLGEAAAEGRGISLDAAKVSGRDGVTGPRPEGAIGFATLRGGDVIGEHAVILAGPGERVTLGHVASDRMLFARGAVRAALWGQDRAPGEYTMRDVLGFGAV